MLKLNKGSDQMEKYVPDIYSKSIYELDYDNLINRGIKCVLFDLDNTLVPPHVKEPSKKLLEFMKELKKSQLRLIIYSNSFGKRVKNFQNQLDVEAFYFVRKPSKGKINIIMKKYNYNQSEIAIIGDQLLTDIVFGNNVGITTILVNQLSARDGLFTKFNRYREKKILKKLYKNNLFAKGKYYE